MSLYSEFQKFNIDAVGVASATTYNKAQGTEFKTCIVALFPYFCGYPSDYNLSIYTHGKDYHLVVRNILTKVAEALKLDNYQIHADIGPEIERGLAAQAGLAFLGKNGMAINEKYGSYFFIGYIACNEEFELSTPNTKTCMGCNKCIESCPGGALEGEFKCDRCLSAITQKKGELSRWEEELIKKNNMVFGCDVCQRVCPHNEGAIHTLIPEFKEGRISSLSLADIEGLTNKEFKEKYGDRAFAWRGKAVLERNIKIIY